MSIVAVCDSLFFGEAKYCRGIRKKMFETVVGACTVISRSFPRWLLRVLCNGDLHMVESFRSCATIEEK